MKKIIFSIAMSFPLIAAAQLTDSATRVIRMQGTVNFRDAGGYKTADGKRVITGKVFRSADISKLTDTDMQVMAGHHIYTVIDFRGKKESAAAEDRLLPNTDYTLSPAGSDSLPDPKQMAQMIKQKGFLMDMYGQRSVQYYGERYRPLFQKLLSLPDTSSILYHCSGGRDRTGMASALFLYVLGVPQQTIEEDFVASNIYLQPMMGKWYKPMQQAFGMSEAEIRAEMDLRPEHIRNFFSAINAEYGSVEKFMQQEMGVGQKEIKLLKQKYTL